MNKLEECVYRIQTNRLAYVPSNLERCRNCTETNMLRCNQYKAYTPQSQIPVRYGRLSIDFMKQFYHKHISIEGLPHEVE